MFFSRYLRLPVVISCPIALKLSHVSLANNQPASVE
jgi:hypothetical protein